MARDPRTHVPGRVYHVMARGNGGQPIVTSPDDWANLLEVIGGVKRTSDFSLYAYCLMTNHFHLLLEIGNDSLSHIMHRIQTTWAKRFNIARGRKGHVFQNRFKSRPCDTDEYFRWLLRYIHLNPVKAGLVKQPQDWRWSSFLQYTGEASGIADTEWPLSLFGSERETPLASFRQFVLDGIGDDVEPKELSDSRVPREEVERRQISPIDPAGVEGIAQQVASEASIELAALFGSSRARNLCAARRLLVARALACGHRASNLALRLGISPTAVSRMSRDRRTAR